MAYRKQGNEIIEYQIIPASERIIKKMTLDEFDRKETELRQYIGKGAMEIGSAMIQKAQERLDEIIALKAKI